MARTTPSFVMKDVSLAVGNVGNRIGQVSEITIPVMAATTEEFRNAGMIKPREIVMGLEATTCQFQETAFDPAMLGLFGIGSRGTHDIIAYGYLESEDGREHAARFEMTCMVKSVDAGAWSPASKSSTTYEVAVHAGVLYIDDEEVYAFDDFGYRVRGVEQRPGRRAALRLG